MPAETSFAKPHKSLRDSFIEIRPAARNWNCPGRCPVQGKSLASKPENWTNVWKIRRSVPEIILENIKFETQGNPFGKCVLQKPYFATHFPRSRRRRRAQTGPGGMDRIFFIMHAGKKGTISHRRIKLTNSPAKILNWKYRHFDKFSSHRNWLWTMELEMQIISYPFPAGVSSNTRRPFSSSTLVPAPEGNRLL